MSTWIDALADDRPRHRVIASERLIQVCRTGDAQDRERVRQSLLRFGLCSDLETQTVIERLVDEIDETELHRELERLVSADPALVERTGAEPSTVSDMLSDHWQTFVTRAGDDGDTRTVFADVALVAGPSLRWRAIESFGNRPHLTLISHLGCVAPSQPHFHDVQSRLVYQRLDRFGWADETMEAANATVRVLGRLIDRTLIDNVYGWSIERRLRLALMYHRWDTGLRICDLVMKTEHRLPFDWTAAMLAMRQIERRGEFIPSSPLRDWSARFAAVQASLDDPRLLAKTPGERRPPPEPALFDAGRVETRVQDVAAWVCWDRKRIDAREQGMPQLVADPLWGVQRGTIGFASQFERDRWLDQLKHSTDDDGQGSRDHGP